MERQLRPALRKREDARQGGRTPKLPTANEMVKQMWVIVATGKPPAPVMVKA